MYSPDWVTSELENMARVGTRRAEYYRVRVPVYSDKKWLTHGVPVSVPAGLNFEWLRQESLPMTLPQIAFTEKLPIRFARQLSGMGGLPPRMMSMSVGSNQRPEMNRKRHDSKLAGFGYYNKALTLVNRTYGSYTEMMDFQQAMSHFPDMEAVITALAANQAVDYAYGQRAKGLKQYVYSSPYYRLPVGIDALQTIFGY